MSDINTESAPFMTGAPWTRENARDYRVVMIEELIKIYKREFGDSWINAFENCVRITV